MAIATKTTDANFKSQTCKTCPEKINPFEMNIIKDGDSKINQPGKPHEHFRSTGIRDNDAERPDEDLYTKVEEILFGGNKWMQWSPKMIRRLADLFDRSPDKCKPTTSQDVLCSNDQANNIASATFVGSLHNMLIEFRDPTTGLVTQEKFKAMWLHNQFPSYTTCEDKKLKDGAWYDERGSKFSCGWYAQDTDRCTQFGSRFAREGYTANTACCACAGGAKNQGFDDFEPARFRSLSLDPSKNQNAFCRDGFYKKYHSGQVGGASDISWPDSNHSLDKCKDLCAKDSRCKAISWCENGDCCSLYDKPCDHPWEGSTGHVSLRKKCH